jgi:hypothetical protein
MARRGEGTGGTDSTDSSPSGLLSDVAARLATPRIPAELWMLWDGGGWVRSIDEARGGPTYLAARSKGEAEKAAVHQSELFGVDCVAVRVK